LVFHHGAKSSDIGQSAGKRPACMKSTFSLSRESFRSLAFEYIPESSDKRVCLSIGAVSHEAHVFIDLRIAEVTEPLVFNQETALLLKNDSDAFAQLLRHHPYMVTKFSFVVYLTRLDLRVNAFSMVFLPAVHGHATDDTLSSFSFAPQILEDDGVDVRGLAFDGDTQYFGFSTTFEALVDQIQRLHLEGGLKGIVANKGLGIFEDIFHLLKTMGH
jgi:hypothetical protein